MSEYKVKAKITPPSKENFNFLLLIDWIDGFLDLMISLHASLARGTVVLQSISMPSNNNAIALPVQNASVGLWNSSLIAAIATRINCSYSKCTVKPIPAITWEKKTKLSVHLKKKWILCYYKWMYFCWKIVIVIQIGQVWYNYYETINNMCLRIDILIPGCRVVTISSPVSPLLKSGRNTYFFHILKVIVSSISLSVILFFQICSLRKKLFYNALNRRIFLKEFAFNRNFLKI